MEAKESITQRLEVGQVFKGLSHNEKLYAHHMCRAAWHGSRILMKQVSPESEDIFDFVIELYHSCAGDWKSLSLRCGISMDELDSFLEYAATVLYNFGNYFGEGDQKFIPSLSENAVHKLGTASPHARSLLDRIAPAMLSITPASLGLPGDNTQSNYYPGPLHLTKGEIIAVTRALEARSIEHENTRMRKTLVDNAIVFEVLQASVEDGTTTFEHNLNGQPITICIKRGDHSVSLAKVCECLESASKYANNKLQRKVLAEYVRSFRTGNLDAYRDSQKHWVASVEPKVEDIFGFVETYHDPLGLRAEWESLVAITDSQETSAFKKFVDNAATFMRRLPWTFNCTDNDGKGPFEKHIFVAPAFTSIHAIAYISSSVSEGINLPNYNDIRETIGFKNVIISNKMATNATGMTAGPLVTPEDAPSFGKCRHRVRFVSTAVHELLGHGTGKLLSEYSRGEFNFDKEKLPYNPVTRKAIHSWYLPGQTWLTVFGGIATSIEECRAMLVAAYLMDDIELSSLFGYSMTTEVTHTELLYNTYLTLAVEGMEALQHFNIEKRTWGQAHSRAHYAIFQQLLRHGHGCVVVEHNATEKTIVVKVDRSKILPHGKDALGEMLLKLHIYRCTADVDAGRPYYEDLTTVGNMEEKWRSVIVTHKEPRRKFVHCNTFLEGDEVILREYDSTNEGLIKSWAERKI